MITSSPTNLSAMINELAITRMELAQQAGELYRLESIVGMLRLKLTRLEENIRSAMREQGTGRIEVLPLIVEEEPVRSPQGVIIDTPAESLPDEFQVIIPSVIKPNEPALRRSIMAGMSIPGVRLAPPETRLKISYRETL